LYKITFTNNAYEVYCTPEHKWPLINTNGQIFNQQTGKVIKKETRDLSRLDKIYFPQFENVLDVDKTLTENDGFVSGWNLGDGWISYHKLHNSNLYGFLFSKEDCENNINNKVLDHINNLNDKECNIRENKGVFEFSSSSKNVDNFFKNIGQTNKKDGLPTIVWKSNDNFIRGLIDGLFSSDGSVDDIRRVISFTSCHEKLAKDVHKLLSFYGIKSYLTKGETENPFNKTKKSIRYDIRIGNKSIIKFNNFFKLSNTNKQKKLDNTINSNEYGKYSKNSKILEILVVII
jgi:intein/homing endonuclease